MGSVFFLIVVVVFVFLCGGILRITSNITLSDHIPFFWRILIQKYTENKLSFDIEFVEEYWIIRLQNFQIPNHTSSLHIIYA